MSIIVSGFFGNLYIEYSKYKLTKEDVYKFGPGTLECEIGKKLASLLGHENEAFYIEWIGSWAKTLFFKLFVKFKGVVDKY